MDSISEVLRAPKTWTLVTGQGKAAAENRTRGPGKARRVWSERHAHRSPHWEIMLAVQGAAWFGLNGRFYPCRPGSLFLIDPDMPHDWFYPSSSQRLEHLWFYPFGEYLLLQWWRIQNGRGVRLHKHLSVLLLDEIGLSLKGFPDYSAPISSERDVPRMWLMIGLIAQYLAWRIKEGDAGAKEKEKRANPVQENVVQSVCRLIEDTAGKGVTLKSLEHFTGYSKYHLHRMFRDRVGCTLHQYVDVARRQRVHQLRKQGVPGEEISNALGFSDVSSYFRWLRKTGNQAKRNNSFPFEP